MRPMAGQQTIPGPDWIESIGIHQSQLLTITSDRVA